jgi:drug/metabolite transporter (DMT)-like permease
VDRASGTPEIGAGTMYTLLAALGFAAVSTLTTIAVGQGLSLWTVQLWRFVLASVVLVTFVGVRGYPRMPWPEALRIILIGGGGQALFIGMALSSLRFLTVATLAFMFYTYPAWVTLVQTVRGAEKLAVQRVIALALSFGGIVVIALGPTVRANVVRASLTIDVPPWPGIALALGAAIVYGIYIPTMQWLQKSHPVPVTSAYAKLGSAICFLFAAFADGTFAYALPSVAWFAIAALAVFATVLPSVFFLTGLMKLGPVRTAIISTVEPFLTAVLGAIVLRQAVTLTTILGGAMIVAAVILLRFRRERVA